MSSRTSDTDRPQVDGYRILKVVGHGGMSTVYLADQKSLGRKVALKVMLPEALADEVSRGRFENEAGTIARLQHPNIVGIHEVGRTSDGLPFYSMPYLSHGHLAQRDLRGDQPRVAGILRALLQALDYAHVRGVVHRDVKAENVLFDDNDNPQLADFGIALRRGSNPRLTSTGLAVGSTAYMPPEQARGATVDRRADLYSLGVLTWEMLTGQLPYNAGDALSMAMMHVQNPVPRLPASLKHWQGLIEKCMAKAPDDRYASAQEMLEALDHLQDRAGKNFGVVEVPPITADAKDPRPRRRWKPVALAAAGVVAVAILAFGVPRMSGNDDKGLPGQPAASVSNSASAAAGTSGDLPVPGANAGEGVLGTINPASTAGISAYLVNAEQQLRDGHLLAPANSNAWDSLDAARRVNPTDLQMLTLSAHLFDALGNASEKALRNGDAAAARAAFERARELDARRGGDGSAIVLLRKRLDAALTARLDAIIAKEDPAGAKQFLDSTAWVGLDPARSRALQTRVARFTAKTRANVAASAEERAPRAHAGLHSVSRAEYARFANETGRAPVNCGRIGLFGARRSWKAPGSEQPDSAPVVCVSAEDAEAYAGWLSAQEKHNYRLPNTEEARSQPAAPVSSWLTLCADSSCSRRMVSGKQRPLKSSRGYNDVGIRLVREG